MQKPRLIIVTGRPGAGKTILAAQLSEAWCLPLISRDRIKEGLVHTEGVCHEELPEDANLRATQAFFGTLDYLLSQGISVIAEAAFQHPLWEKGLTPLMAKARLSIIVCRVGAQTALDRFLARGLTDERRTYFHGDKGVHMFKSGVIPEPGDYNEPHLDAPTFIVDTTDGYSPNLQALYRFIWEEGL